MSPKTTAIISAIAIILMAIRIFGADEAASSTLTFLTYAFLILGIIGLIGSLIQISRQ